MQADPELIFLKWAFKAGAIDADQLHEFVTRSHEEPGEFLLDLLLRWEFMTREEMADLLSEERLERAVADGVLEQKLLVYIQALEVPAAD